MRKALRLRPSSVGGCCETFLRQYREYVAMPDSQPDAPLGKYRM